MIRDLINQHSVNPPIDYCIRVTAEDEVEDTLRQFQDNENYPNNFNDKSKIKHRC